MAALFVRDVLTPRAGREEALAQALAGLAEAEFVAAQPHGAQAFRLYREENGPRWLLEEAWENRAAFDAFHAHHCPPELLAFPERADDLLAEPLAHAVSCWTAADGQDERRLVASVFERIAALDPDGLVALFAPDGRQVMPFAPEGFPTVFEGRETLARQYRTLLNGYASVAFPDLAIHALDAPGRWLATYRTDIAFKDGRTYRNRYVALFTVAAGAVVEWAEYFDPVTLTRELGNPFADQPGGEAQPSFEPANIQTVRAYLDRLSALDIEGWGYAPQE